MTITLSKNNTDKITRITLFFQTKIAEWEYEGHTGTLMFTSRVESDKPGGSRHFKIVTIIVMISDSMLLITD